MGFRGWCVVESKHFVLDVKGGSSGLNISETCRGVTRSILLGRKNSFWLLDTVVELLSANNSSAFWRKSRDFPGIYAQRCVNKHGRFLTIEDYGDGRRRGVILVPEGRKGEGWEAFRLELLSAVNYMKKVSNGVAAQSKKKHDPTLARPPAPTKLPDTSRRRSYAETLLSSNSAFEPPSSPIIIAP
jgi:hypothetical protein